MHFNLDALRERALSRVAQCVCRHPVVVIVASVLLTVACCIYTSTSLKFKTNRNDLVRADSETHSRFLKYMAEFRVDEDFIIVVEGNDQKRNQQCVESIAARLRERPGMFPNVFYRLDFSPLDDRLLLYLDEAQLREIAASQKDFASVIEKLGPSRDLVGMLRSANNMMAADRLQREGEFEKMQPFLDSFVKNLEQVGHHLNGKAGGVEHIAEIFAGGSGLKELARQAKEHEYVSFENGRIYLLLVNPKPDDNQFTRFDAPLRELREVVRETRAEFPGLNIGLTGEPVLDNDEMEASASDAAKASVITIILIAALYLFAYREVTRPGLVVVNLIVATTWTMGFATLAVGHLNILTVTFVSMVLGLGEDYAIQVLGRFEEELSNGLTAENALVTTLTHTGNAVLTGALVTAAGFFTMCLNEFIGLAELGIIAGGGMILTFLATITLFPAMLILRERHLPPNTQFHSRTGFSRTAELERQALRYPWAVLAVVMVVTAIATYNALTVRFDHNLLHLQSKEIESVQYERRLVKSSSRSTIFAVVMCDSVEEARAKKEALLKLPTVADVVGVPDFVPVRQADKAALIADIQKGLAGLDFKTDALPHVDLDAYLHELNALRDKMRMYAKFAELARETEASAIFGRLIPPMDYIINTVHTMPASDAKERLTSYQNQLLPELQKQIDWLRRHRTDAPITVDDIPPSLRTRYVGRTGKLLIEVFPKEDIWEREPLHRFVDEVTSVAAQATGAPIQLFHYVNLLKISYQKAALYALAAVLVMIFLHFRSVLATLLTLVPLLIGCVWTLGWMRVHALQFNPANIIALPLTVGIGIAFGVYLVDRFRETGTAGSFSSSTGRSILVSALTTMFGFGTLMLAGHRGIASLGELMTGAIGFCLLSALVVMPPLLEFCRLKGWKP